MSIVSDGFTAQQTFVRHLIHEGGLIGLTGHTLEPYQTAFLRDRSTVRAVLKSRQVGFSWAFAAEALLHALFSDRTTSLFISLGQREAQEKVRYTQELHDALPARFRAKVTHASREEIEFANGSRVLSFPSRAPRGFAGANVYLDELAFYPDDREVYLGTLPVISRGGRLTLGSTPFGPRGVFWEQVQKQLTAETQRRGEPHENPNVGFHEVPWWRCSWMVSEDIKRQLSKGGSPRLCVSAVEELPTAERVERYGSDRLKQIYAAMDPESFWQEYECEFLEERDAFITHAEILPCIDETLDPARSLHALGEADAPLYAGFDVGRKVHPSELVILERDRDGPARVRLIQGMKNTEFAEQTATLRVALFMPQLRRLSLDATGMGFPLAEELDRCHPFKVEPVVFTSQVKERLAMGLKLALQRRQIVLPPDRELIAQLRSIRREFGEGGRSRFEAANPSEAGAERGSHADQFWALCLAWHASECDRHARLGSKVLGKH